MVGNINIEVGKRIKYRRTVMGLSQSALAKALGISFQQVQKYEKGSNSLNSNRLYELGKFLKVPVAYFFEELEANNSNIKQADNLILPKSVGSDRESLEMMKAFQKINDSTIRKRVSDLMRAIADK